MKLLPFAVPFPDIDGAPAHFAIERVDIIADGAQLGELVRKAPDLDGQRAAMAVPENAQGSQESLCRVLAVEGVW